MKAAEMRLATPIARNNLLELEIVSTTLSNLRVESKKSKTIRKKNDRMA
jgi:hypothetical protein